MSHQLDDSVKHRAIEFLASEAELPFDVVAEMYEHERAELHRDAKVKQFLPIFTFRGVQEKLRQRRVAFTPPAQPPNRREPSAASVHFGSVHPGSVQLALALEGVPLRLLEQPVDEEPVELVRRSGIDEMR